jgi:hypothetical protein
VGTQFFLVDYPGTILAERTGNKGTGKMQRNEAAYSGSGLLLSC